MELGEDYNNFELMQQGNYQLYNQICFYKQGKTLLDNEWAKQMARPYSAISCQSDEEVKKDIEEMIGLLAKMHSPFSVRLARVLHKGQSREKTAETLERAKAALKKHQAQKRNK